MFELLGFIADHAKEILIALFIYIIIKIWYWLSIHNSITNTEKNTYDIDDDLCQMNNNIAKQNEVIIKNQKRIIELLEKQCPEVDSSHDESQ